MVRETTVMTVHFFQRLGGGRFGRLFHSLNWSIFITFLK